MTQQITSNEWKARESSSDDRIKLSVAKKSNFMYLCEGTIRKGKEHVREAVDYLDESNWKQVTEI